MRTLSEKIRGHRAEWLRLWAPCLGVRKEFKESRESKKGEEEEEEVIHKTGCFVHKNILTHIRSHP